MIIRKKLRGTISGMHSRYRFSGAFIVAAMAAGILPAGNIPAVLIGVAGISPAQTLSARHGSAIQRNESHPATWQRHQSKK